MKILFCDDEPDILEIYSCEFKHFAPDNEYFMADKAEEALEICRQHKIDVLFTDSKMPHMSGLELLKALKAEGIYPNKVFMITGYTNEFKSGHEIYQLVEGVYPKPPDFDILLSLVH
jgi:YesN/AraC family two-component response regulator